MRHLLIGAAPVLAASSALAASQAPRPDQAAFRALYKELVETNTTLSAGSCTEAAAKMGARLKTAGYADSDITYFADPAHPKEGELVETNTTLSAGSCTEAAAKMGARLKTAGYAD